MTFISGDYFTSKQPFIGQENQITNISSDNPYLNYIPMVQNDSFFVLDTIVPQMNDVPSFNLWNSFNPKMLMSEVSMFNKGGWFNNICNGINTLWAAPQNTVSYNEATERKPIEVEGVNYGIMGNDAAKIKLLRPEMQRKVSQMFEYAKSKGWTLSITSAYRSTKKQTYLYNEWKAGRHNVPVVAKPGTSRHEFGCAVDISVTGNGASAEKMGAFGRSIGLRWGGDWRSNRETWHFDLDPCKTADA